jgi:LPS-assembly protein
MDGSASEAPGAVVEFSADQVAYDSETDILSASGQVRMSREGNYLAADRVIWNRETGEVRAEGDVVVVDPQGNRLVGDSVVLSDTLRDGTINNLLVVLESGGRIAAERGTRADGVITLENAAYSPCPVTTEGGCPRRPSWMITAARVIDDPANNRLRFQGGRLQLFGVTLPLLPVFSVGTDGAGATGWLVPELKISRSNGFEVALPYYWRIAPNRDLALIPHLYTGTFPAMEARYRELNSLGAFQVGGFATYSRVEDADFTPSPAGERKLRGYFEANGKYQLDPMWSVTGFLRAASDKTVTRRYDITRDDRLRNFINAERITPTATSPSPAGPSRAFGSTTSRSRSRSRFRRSMPDSSSSLRCSTGGSSCRRTACRSSGSKARIRRGHLQARAGTFGGSPRWGSS